MLVAWHGFNIAQVINIVNSLSYKIIARVINRSKNNQALLMMGAKKGGGQKAKGGICLKNSKKCTRFHNVSKKWQFLDMRVLQVAITWAIDF